VIQAQRMRKRLGGRSGEPEYCKAQKHEETGYPPGSADKTYRFDIDSLRDCVTFTTHNTLTNPAPHLSAKGALPASILSLE
jgi:hypothetical protein